MGDKEVKKSHKDSEKLVDKYAEFHSLIIDLERMASVGELVRGLGHDINNSLSFLISNNNQITAFFQSLKPINEMYGKLIEALPSDVREANTHLLEQLQKLKEKADMDYFLENVDNLLEDNHEGLMEISRTISDLRQFTIFERAELKEIDINKTIRTVLSVLGYELKRRARVETSFGDIPDIAGYSTEFNQAVLHILLNSIERIPDQGVITVQTSVQDSWVVIEVEDNGDKILSEQLNNDFISLIATEKKNYNTNLHLYIARSIVDMHSGNLQIKSDARNNTKIIVRLPITGE